MCILEVIIVIRITINPNIMTLIMYSRGSHDILIETDINYIN